MLFQKQEQFFFEIIIKLALPYIYGLSLDD